MRIMAQMAMVMNLDKCIGCHTCSVTCKQAWTNRTGTEYVWFNNVETRPGLGYPRTYEDQEEWQGGWVRKGNGRLALRAGGRFKKLANIFSNPKLPSIEDYYEPWTYDYATLLNSPSTENFPVAIPKSLITGKDLNVQWSANWDDDLGGSMEIAVKDPMLKGIEDKVKFEFEQTFMFYLPRICEHCLNPSCAASCPSGAIYKRTEDGIVLVDQDKCRGWRMCVSGCPYKKVYFNHKTGKAEKCTFCYPRIEVGIPTVCAETCVGRLRYIGLMLYDADKVLAAASVENDHDLYEAQCDVFLDPNDPQVAREAELAGIPLDWIEAAKISPVRRLIQDYKVALPLHPEYRTMPMVWYIPPLSPVVDVVRDTGHDAENQGNLFAAIDTLRIPVEYLANLFTAGDTKPVTGVLQKLAAMRSFMRDINLGGDGVEEIAESVGMDGESMYEMFRLLALAKYDERYVIPTAHAEQAHGLEELATDCPVDFSGDGLSQTGSFGEGSGELSPVAVENFRMLQERQTSEVPEGELVGGGAKRGRVNLLNWDGKGKPKGLFPEGAKVKLFARHRLAGPAKSALSDQQLAITWQVASLLLDYPTPEGRAALPQLAELVAGLPEPVCGALGSLIAHVGTGELADRQQEYVDTFDHTRRNCLYLTYYAYGDTRRRGVALVQFKQAFQKAGVEFNDSELPDHLGAVLEFGATVDRAVAWKLINDYRAGLEMLRLALERRNSPYAGAAVAVCATLPMLNGDEADAVNRLIADGPPAEDVGLETYGLDPRLNPHPRDDEPYEPALGAGSPHTSPSEPTLLGSHIPVGASR